jgi:hypothetical protein
MAALQKQRAVARRLASKGMARGVADHIGLGLDDPAADASGRMLVDQSFAD